MTTQDTSRPIGSSAMQIVAGMKPQASRAVRAHRMTVKQRCVEINEELRKLREVERAFAASVILDGVIDIDDATEVYGK